MPGMLKSVRRRASVSSQCSLSESSRSIRPWRWMKKPIAAHQLVVVGQVVDAVVVVEAVAQLGPQLLPVRVGDAERRARRRSVSPRDEPPPVGRKVRRQKDDVQIASTARSLCIGEKLGGPG